MGRSAGQLIKLMCYWASGASGRSLTFDGTTSSEMNNDDIYRMTEQPPLSSIVKRRRLSLFGHIAGMDGEADMQTEYRLSPYRSSGEDLQGDHAPPGSKLDVP